MGVNRTPFIRTTRAYRSALTKRRWADSAARQLGLVRTWAWGYRIWMRVVGAPGRAYTGEVDGLPVNVRSWQNWWTGKVTATVKVAGLPPGLRFQPCRGLHVWQRRWTRIEYASGDKAVKASHVSSLDSCLTDTRVARIARIGS